MATTSLWRVRGYIGKVLLYTQNPDKTTQAEPLNVPEQAVRDTLGDVIAYAGREEATNQRELVWGINCTPENARKEMLAVKVLFGKEDGTIAYHGFQSFREGEVTPEQAHQIGIQLAQELWGDRYQVLVATHLDKASHIHSHFVINTVSFVDGRKFHRTAKDYQRMRDVSDRLCREWGLSVIEKPEGRGMHYSEWSAQAQGDPTHRSRIREDIDRAILASTTQRDFLRVMAEMGYQVKTRGSSGQPLKYPSVKPPDAKGYFRLHKLGPGYSLEDITQRILHNIQKRNPFPVLPEPPRRGYHRKGIGPGKKVGGLRGLYFYYCYQLHILRWHPNYVKRVSFLLREDVRKLERLDEQARFLARTHINHVEDLLAYAQHQMQWLDGEAQRRRQLHNLRKVQLRRGDVQGAEETRQQIEAITRSMKEPRKEVRLCREIAERSGLVQERWKMLHQQRKAQQEVKQHESFRGRRRTDGAYEPGRS